MDDNIPDLVAPPQARRVNIPQANPDDEMDVDTAQHIKMVVLDGIVMGPQVNDF